MSVGDSSAEWNQRRECCVWARIPGSQVWISQGNPNENTLGGGDGQGDLACCSPWGRKESDTMERLN